MTVVGVTASVVEATGTVVVAAPNPAGTTISVAWPADRTTTDLAFSCAGPSAAQAARTRSRPQDDQARRCIRGNANDARTDVGYRPGKDLMENILADPC